MTIEVKKAFLPEHIKQCLDVRLEVFVKGQNVPFDLEVDGKDQECDQYLIKHNKLPAGTARVMYLDNIAKIQRVAILESYQGKGLGKILMEYILNDLSSDKTIKKVTLGSQVHAIGFYEKLGFTTCSDEYLDAEIPHKDMQLTL